MKIIPYGRQTISDADVVEVEKILRSDWLTQGPAIERFESTAAEYCSVPYALAVCNATAALHLACRSLGLTTGDVVWTSPNTFLASANCALYCGASIDFVDIDPRTFNLCPNALAKKLARAEKQGNLPKVVIPVHFAGQPCDMEQIAKLSKQYGFSVIEDASHAVGASYLNHKVGNCQYSDITIFSFHPVKIITTGEGGMLLTKNRELHQRALRLRSHGMTRDANEMDKEKEGDWYYQQIDLGYNYRMTDIQAALGMSQWQRLDEFVARRRYLAERYHDHLKGLKIVLPWQDVEQSESAWHLYVIQVESRAEVFESLRSAGIYVNVHYIPVHTQPYYQKLGFKEGDYPCAEFYYQRAISLPLYYELTIEEQDFVIHKLREIL